MSLSSASRLLAAAILAGALAGSAMAQAPDAGCALPSEPKGIPAAIDATITGLVVPLLLITHGLAFRILLQHQSESAIPSTCLDAKSNGKIFLGVLLLNFTARRASILRESLQLKKFSPLRIVRRVMSERFAPPCLVP
jgi:hypothetical protein